MKKSGILSTCLVSALLLTGVTPTFASATESVSKEYTPKIDLVTNLIKDNQSIESLKNNIKYSTVKINKNEISNVATVMVNGVEADIILGSSKEVTDEMLLNLTKNIQSEQNSNSPTQKSESLIGTRAVENPGGGTVIGTRKNSFNAKGAKAVSSILNGAFTGIASAVGYYYGAVGGGVIAGVSTSAGDYINVKERYTTSKTVKSWSSYYDTYLFDHYITIYTNSSRTKVDKVVVRYDTRSKGNCIGCY